MYNTQRTMQNTNIQYTIQSTQKIKYKIIRYRIQNMQYIVQNLQNI